MLNINLIFGIIGIRIRGFSKKNVVYEKYLQFVLIEFNLLNVVEMENEK